MESFNVLALSPRPNVCRCISTDTTGVLSKSEPVCSGPFTQHAWLKLAMN